MKSVGTGNLKRSKIWILSILVLGLLLVACGPEVSLTSTPEGVESSETTVAASLISVQVFPAEQEKRQLTEEEIPLDNCKGVETLSSAVERSHKVFHVAEIGTSTELNVEGELGVPGVGAVAVGSAIAQYYNTSYGEEDEVSRSVTVSAKEGTNMLHTVEQFELWETGEVAVFVGGEEVKREPYSFRKDFGVQVVDIVNVGDCAGTPTPMAGAGEGVVGVAEEQPTYTPLPTFTPYPTFTPLPKDTATPRPTNTPTAEPVNTEPGSELAVRETWIQDGVWLTLKSVSRSSEWTHSFWFDIENHTGNDIVFDVNESTTEILNKDYGFEADRHSFQRPVPPDHLANGESGEFQVFFNTTWGFNFFSNDTDYFYLHIDDLSRIDDALWRIDVPH